MTAPLRLTLFKNLVASVQIPMSLTTEQITSMLVMPSARVKNGLPLLSLQGFGNLPTAKNCLRWDGNVVESWGVAGDYDGEELDYPEAIERLNRAQLEAIVYTSPSYTPEKPRWRVLCWFSQGLEPAQMPRMMDRLNGALGGVLKGESWALSQGFFYGRVVGGHEVVIEASEGEPLDLRDELDEIAIGKPASKANGAAHTHSAGNGRDGPDTTRSGAALAVAGRLYRAGKSFEDFCVALRNSPDAAIQIWLAKKGAERQLQRAWDKVARDAQAPGTTPRLGRPAPSPRDKPIIQIVGGDLTEVIDEAETQLVKLDRDLYQRGDFVVRPATVPIRIADNRMVPGLRLVRVKTNHLVERLTYWINFQKWSKQAKKWVSMDCPSKVAATYLERVGCWRLPVLTGVTNCPTLRADGSVIDQPGYDTATGLLYNPGGVEFPKILEKPSKDDAARALALLKALIDEFKFVDHASRSVALSGILTSVIRRSLATAPLHAFNAPVAGSGKSKLVNIASIISCGHEAPVITPGETKEELEKRLGSQLLAGDAVISFDNCDGPLRSALLCQVLTESIIKIRILGKSESPIVPNNAAFFATGNNIVLVGDLTRRSIRATLDPQCERPELLDFKDKDLIGTVFRNRPELAAAALTILRAHHVADRPASGFPLGSFEMWWGWPRAALVWLDQADPCDTIEKVRQDDPRTQALSNVLTQWKAAFGINELTAKEVVDRATDYLPQQTTDFNNRRPSFMFPELREALLAVAAERGMVDTQRLGFWLRSVNGRIIDDMRLTQGFRKRSWKLEEVRR
jgi:hypothetical protein